MCRHTEPACKDEADLGTDFWLILSTKRGSTCVHKAKCHLSRGSPVPFPRCDAVQPQLLTGWAAATAAQALACLQAFIPRALLVPEGFGNSYNVNDYFH